MSSPAHYICHHLAGKIVNQLNKKTEWAITHPSIVIELYLPALYRYKQPKYFIALSTAAEVHTPR
jgi:hypothetical protein